MPLYKDIQSKIVVDSSTFDTCILLLKRNECFCNLETIYRLSESVRHFVNSWILSQVMFFWINISIVHWNRNEKKNECLHVWHSRIMIHWIVNKKREEFINANKRSKANKQLLIFCFGVNPPKTPTNLYLISLIFQGT